MISALGGSLPIEIVQQERWSMELVVETFHYESMIRV